MRRWLPAALLAFAIVAVCLAVWSWPDWIAGRPRNRGTDCSARSDPSRRRCPRS